MITGGFTGWCTQRRWPAISSVLSSCESFGDLVRGSTKIQPFLFYPSHREVFEGNPEVNIPELLQSETVYQFDDRFTRKLFGYNSVRHYYRDGSSDLYLSTVAVPLLCLQAEDDPISVNWAIPYEIIAANPFVTLMVSNSGGHIGWFSGLFNPEPWSSQVFLKYFDDIFEVSRPPVSIRLSPLTPLSSFQANKNETLQQITQQLRSKQLPAVSRVGSLRLKFLNDGHQAPTPGGVLKPATSPSDLTPSHSSSPAPLLPDPSFVILPREQLGRDPSTSQLWPKGSDIPLSSLSVSAVTKELTVNGIDLLRPAATVAPAPALQAKLTVEQNGHHNPEERQLAPPSHGAKAWMIPVILIATFLVIGYTLGNRKRR